MLVVPKESFAEQVRATPQGQTQQRAETGASGHPLEERVKNWNATATQARMDQYRRLFGAADPIKREMDLALVGDNLHGDILRGNDWSIDWEDVYKN